MQKPVAYTRPLQHHQYLTDNADVIHNKREIFQCNEMHEILLKVIKTFHFLLSWMAMLSLMNHEQNERKFKGSLIYSSISPLLEEEGIYLVLGSAPVFIHLKKKQCSLFGFACNVYVVLHN
jgi:hypothetical protein